MHPGYLDKLLMGKEDIQRRTEYSPNNHFMYWVDKRSRSERQRAAKKVKDAKLHGNDDAHGGFGRGDQVSFTLVTNVSLTVQLILLTFYFLNSRRRNL